MASHQEASNAVSETDLNPVAKSSSMLPQTINHTVDTPALGTKGSLGKLVMAICSVTSSVVEESIVGGEEKPELSLGQRLLIRGVPAAIAGRESFSDLGHHGRATGGRWLLTSTS